MHKVGHVEGFVRPASLCTVHKIHTPETQERSQKGDGAAKGSASARESCTHFRQAFRYVPHRGSPALLVPCLEPPAAALLASLLAPKKRKRSRGVDPQLWACKHRRGHQAQPAQLTPRHVRDPVHGAQSQPTALRGGARGAAAGGAAASEGWRAAPRPQLYLTVPVVEPFPVSALPYPPKPFFPLRGLLCC